VLRRAHGLENIVAEYVTHLQTEECVLLEYLTTGFVQYIDGRDHRTFIDLGGLHRVAQRQFRLLDLCTEICALQGNLVLKFRNFAYLLIRRSQLTESISLLRQVRARAMMRRRAMPATASPGLRTTTLRWRAHGGDLRVTDCSDTEITLTLTLETT